MRRLEKADALACLDAEHATSCRMCELARTGAVLAANDHAVAVLDRYAARPGHVLVILRRHEERIAALPWPDYQSLHHLAWRVARAIERAVAPSRIYIAALGSAVPRSTSFPHVHLHVVPLADGGEVDRPGNVFTWTKGIYVFEDEAEEHTLLERLRVAIEDAAPGDAR